LIEVASLSAGRSSVLTPPFSSLTPLDSSLADLSVLL